LKPPLIAIISILVAEYAFLQGAYSFALFLAACIERRRVQRETGTTNFILRDLTIANFCEGCEHYHSLLQTFERARNEEEEVPVQRLAEQTNEDVEKETDQEVKEAEDRDVNKLMSKSSVTESSRLKVD
jgi:hypothetical protein